MNRPLHLVAIIDAQPEAAAAVEDALRRLLEPTRAEPGCIRYELFVDRERPQRFYMQETWADDQALAAHLTSLPIAAFRRQTDGLLAQVELLPMSALA